MDQVQSNVSVCEAVGCGRGFTLIELLVVITIIVVLLSLLTPALDRAIYTAELTVCAANQKATLTSTQVYAASNKRRYPHRGALENAWKPNQLKGGFVTDTAFGSNGDDRDVFRDYFSINASMNDPLTEQVDFELAHENSGIEVCYFLWGGFRFNGNAGMMKIGDRFAWNGNRFNLLVSDRDVIAETLTQLHGSHPDADGLMRNHVQNNTSDVPGGTESGFIKLVMTRWQKDGQPFERGEVDLNFGYDDGSVIRMDKITFSLLADEIDERMAEVPEFADNHDFRTIRALIPPVGSRR